MPFDPSNQLPARPLRARTVAMVTDCGISRLQSDSSLNLSFFLAKFAASPVTTPSAFRGDCAITEIAQEASQNLLHLVSPTCCVPVALSLLSSLQRAVSLLSSTCCPPLRLPPWATPVPRRDPARHTVVPSTRDVLAPGAESIAERRRSPIAEGVRW